MAISSPCFSHCSCTIPPLTWVPLRLPKSRTWNFPSCPRTTQCLRETEGSVTATAFEASRPMVISPSDKGIVESFNGPESTTSLGRKASHPVPFLSHFD